MVVGRARSIFEPSRGEMEKRQATVALTLCHR